MRIAETVQAGWLSMLPHYRIIVPSIAILAGIGLAACQEPRVVSPDAIVIAVDESGKITVDGETVSSDEVLDAVQRAIERRETMKQ